MAVLDASALLALLLDEPGSEAVKTVPDDAVLGVALARGEKGPALTAERRWPEIAAAAGVAVRVIR